MAALPWPDWETVRVLGSGGGGTATLLRCRQRGVFAVCKTPAPGVDPSVAVRELRNLLIAHRYGVAPRPLGWLPDGGILMEYVAGQTALPVRDRLAAVARALTILHNRSLIHADLKPDNIIGASIIDFGSMFDLMRDDPRDLYATVGYAAPEAYRGEVSPALDAYGLGWVLVAWLGGPTPDMPPVFGPPAAWTAPDGWQPTVAALLHPDPDRRLSVGLLWHTLVGPTVRLPSGAYLATDLVTTAAWQRVMGTPWPRSATLGYLTDLTADLRAAYLHAVGGRLPTLAELRALSVGTERTPATRDTTRAHTHGAVSDLGARHCRRFLWQPTADGVLWGGTPYADHDTIPFPPAPNPMIGLRVAWDSPPAP